MSDIQQNLLNAPYFLTSGLKIVAIEILIFVLVYLYLKGNKKQLSTLTTIAVIVIVLTLIGSFARMYFSIIPIYNLTQ